MAPHVPVFQARQKLRSGKVQLVASTPRAHASVTVELEGSLLRAEIQCPTRSLDPELRFFDSVAHL
jgi:hypothetical protein